MNHEIVYHMQCLFYKRLQLRVLLISLLGSYCGWLFG